ncbi:MAG: translation initiation factor IF-2 subunit alpha [Thermoplasmata archaeon]
MPHKVEYPEAGDLVVCSVQNVKNFGAFVSLDEYGGKEGFIHVRDVATGWVKYIRDHVREGQKIVCKVLSVDKERGHIDLSLKQVNEHQKREKIQEWKNEKKAEKLLEIVGTKMGKNLDEAYAEAGEKLINEFGELYSAFEEVNVNPDALKEVGLDKKWAAAVTEVAKENIQTPSVTIDGVLEISNPKSDGIDHIKKALAIGVDTDDAAVKIHYVGAPKYRISVTAEDYKVAEQELKATVTKITAAVQKAGGAASFKRKEEK